MCNIAPLFAEKTELECFVAMDSITLLRLQLSTQCTKGKDQSCINTKTKIIPFSFSLMDLVAF